MFGFTIVYLSTYLLNDILGASKFWQLWITICRHLCNIFFFSMDINFQFLWLNTDIPWFTMQLHSNKLILSWKYCNLKWKLQDKMVEADPNIWKGVWKFFKDLKRYFLGIVNYIIWVSPFECSKYSINIFQSEKH